MKLRLEAGKLRLTLDLLETPTAKALFEAAPFEARVRPGDPVKAARA